ncbi:FkbM family methyltransferase [Candidatus Lokiarchaeum ossiferum]|uniref:FkbM family methyltransferase n=1 Tax=Candidatus Lokiarchaeum ossiferum TaxID=2951803 RepID=UPI00352CC61B
MNNLILPNGESLYYIDKLTALYVYNEIYVEKQYLQHEISISDGDIIFDVGGNIGLFSRFVQNCAKNLDIYIFEPVPVIFKVLSANIASDSNFTHLFNVGLSNEEKDIEFYYFPKVCADSTAHPVDWDFKLEKYLENYNDVVVKTNPLARIVPKFLRKWVVNRSLKKLYQSEKIRCHVRTLSSFIEEHDIKRIDLLKIDAENAEREVIAGIQEDHWPLIRQISMEVHAHIVGCKNLHHEMQSFLTSKGFSVYLVEDDLGSRMGVYMLYAKRI